MKPISLKPTSGGRLMSDASAANIGLANYRVKRDWRRVLDREVRAEGYLKWAPNLEQPEIEQAYPPGVDGQLLLIAETILPSGRRAVVCGTATTLWVYFGLTETSYVAGDENGPYVEAGYFVTNPGQWFEIGRGFAADGQRWEAVPVGSWLVLNNGTDLPMTYRVGEESVTPIYELREQGIASVGTIAEINGILCCMDIRQIPEGAHDDLRLIQAAVVSGGVTGAKSSLDENPLQPGIFGGTEAIFGGTERIN